MGNIFDDVTHVANNAMVKKGINAVFGHGNKHPDHVEPIVKLAASDNPDAVEKYLNSHHAIPAKDLIAAYHAAPERVNNSHSTRDQLAEAVAALPPTKETHDLLKEHLVNMVNNTTGGRVQEFIEHHRDALTTKDLNQALAVSKSHNGMASPYHEEIANVLQNEIKKREHPEQTPAAATQPQTVSAPPPEVVNWQNSAIGSSMNADGAVDWAKVTTKVTHGSERPEQTRTGALNHAESHKSLDDKKPDAVNPDAKGEKSLMDIAAHGTAAEMQNYLDKHHDKDGKLTIDPHELAAAYKKAGYERRDKSVSEHNNADVKNADEITAVIAKSVIGKNDQDSLGISWTEMHHIIRHTSGKDLAAYVEEHKDAFDKSSGTQMLVYGLTSARERPVGEPGREEAINAVLDIIDKRPKDQYTAQAHQDELTRLSKEGSAAQIESYIKKHKEDFTPDFLADVKDEAAKRHVTINTEDKKPEEKKQTSTTMDHHVQNMGFHSAGAHDSHGHKRHDVNVNVTHDKDGAHVTVDGKVVEGKQVLEDILKHNKENAYHIHNMDQNGKNMTYAELLGDLTPPKTPARTGPAAGHGTGR